jgi:hypothetical protein
MMTDDNIIDFPDTTSYEPTDAEWDEAMSEFDNIDETDRLGLMIGSVLEMLTHYAADAGPYYITAENDAAITLIATGDDVAELLSLLPDKYNSWDSLNSDNDFIQNADPGDEQSEPTPES